MPDLVSSMNKTSPAGLGRQIIKLPQQEQQQKLSYQTNKLAQYVQLQLSDLENTLHYIQKKHSINQIKESISHAYSIFSQTQPVFRELRILFIYDKIKKLVNCFSIIYLILIEHIEKPSKIIIQSDTTKNISDLPETSNHLNDKPPVTNKNLTTNANYTQNSDIQTLPNTSKKLKPLGGVHLYNQQYNRHIESDLDRLKRKLKEQARETLQNSPKVSEKDKFKEEIFKEINTDIYGSPSPDELTLFFNLNSNRYGSDLQYITFQDQLQEIATFFKQSQDEALEFLNKSRDDFILLNINQGFQEIMVQYKVEKQEQVNSFVSKVKNLFGAIKNKTVEKQNLINHQISELKRIQKRIIKPISFEIQTQTSFSFQDQISKLKKKIDEVQKNYKELQNYHSKENQNDSKNITFLEHKIAFKEHEISILKKQLDEKNHFIDFLNDKINSGTDPKVLKKISNIYRSHSKKHSNKIKVQLQQLEKQVTIELIGLRNKGTIQPNEEEDGNHQRQTSERLNEDPEAILGHQEKKSIMNPFEEYDKPNKKKRKQGISFFASPQKRFAHHVQRNASFNILNTRIEEQRSEGQKASSGDMTLYEQQQEGQNAKLGQIQSFSKKDKQSKNFVKADKKKSQDRNSLQVMQKSKFKNFEPKKSAFASGFGNTKSMQNTASRFALDKRQSSITKQNFSDDTARQNFEEEEELMRQITNMSNQNRQGFPVEDNQNDEDSQQRDSDMEQDEQEENYDEMHEEQQNYYEQKKRASLKRGGQIQENNQVKKGKINEVSRNLDSDTKSKFTNAAKNNIFLKVPSQQTEQKRVSPFRRKQSKIQGLQTKNQDNLRRASIQNQYKSSLSNRCSQPVEDFDVRKINKKSNKFHSQDMQEYDDQMDFDFDDQDDQTSETSDHAIGRFLKTVSSDSQFDALSPRQKDNMISTYFNTIYKDKKIRASNLCSCLINISIGQNQAKPPVTQTQIIAQSSSQDASKENNQPNPANSKSRNSKTQQIKDKSKLFPSTKLNELKKHRGKLSESDLPDSMPKPRENHRMSQNLNIPTNDLNTFKEITTTPEAREQQNSTQRQKEPVIEGISELEQTTSQKNQQNSTDYERIYGISLSSWNVNKKENTDYSMMSQQEKKKMEDYLEKTAMRTAMKCKNIEQFKARIKKMHMSRCGQSCKHLERYLDNFNKYRCCNREIMKIHIENVNNVISSESMVRLNKQNSVTLPSINVLGPADSSKGFCSIQRNIGAVKK